MSLNNVSPNWKAEGIEPLETLKEKGFMEGYKMPAEYVNWFWSTVSKCISELQDVAIPITGTYTGTGATENTFFASLGYKPKKVEILPNSNVNCAPLIFIKDAPHTAGMRSSATGMTVTATWSENGLTFSGGSTNVAMNDNGVTYYYIIHK